MLRRFCRVCQTPEEEPFFRIEGVPVQDGLLWPSPEEAARAPTADIELVFCGRCGYIGNRAFDVGRLRYPESYDISLHHSPVYRDFIDSLVSRLVETYDLRGKSILEIGSGKGDFLRALCERGGNRGLGYDPTSRAEEGLSGAVRFRREFYTEGSETGDPDFLCCRHVLEHLVDLRGFVGMVRRALADDPTRVAYFEVPDGSLIFRRRVIWNVVYEHGSFFTRPSLGRLFAEEGFEVLAIAPCFRNEYLGMEATPARGRGKSPDEPGELSALAEQIRSFGEVYRETTSRWNEWGSELRRSGRQAVLWGSGARAVSFLAALRPGEEIPYLVDINPKRQGLFMPGTAQPVAAPESLVADPPDTILITNPAFEAEIRGQAAGLGLKSRIVVLD